MVEPPTFDVILVLGARVRPDGKPGPAIKRRVAHAVREYHRGAASRLLMSGGSFGDLPVESLVMRDLAIESGVPADDVAVEDKSRNTLENMAFSLQILRRNGWHRVLVVTDGFHLPRALLMLRRLGVRATGSRAPGAPMWYRVLAGSREAAMFAWTWAQTATATRDRDIN